MHHIPIHLDASIHLPRKRRQLHFIPHPFRQPLQVPHKLTLLTHSADSLPRQGKHIFRPEPIVGAPKVRRSELHKGHAVLAGGCAWAREDIAAGTGGVVAERGGCLDGGEAGGAEGVLAGEDVAWAGGEGARTARADGEAGGHVDGEGVKVRDREAFAEYITCVTQGP